MSDLRDVWLVTFVVVLVWARDVVPKHYWRPIAAGVVAGMWCGWLVRVAFGLGA